MVAGRWVDPDRAKAPLTDYAASWLLEQAGLAPSDPRDSYVSLLRVHILPALGEVSLGRLDAAAVRRWHRSCAEGKSPSMAPEA